MISKIRTEIEDSLENIYDFDYESVKSNVSNILNKYNADYKVVCDETNNPPYQNNINVDVYIQPKSSTQTIVSNIIIEPSKNSQIKKLRRERKDKLDKLNEL